MRVKGLVMAEFKDALQDQATLLEEHTTLTLQKVDLTQQLLALLGDDLNIELISGFTKRIEPVCNQMTLNSLKQTETSAKLYRLIYELTDRGKS